MKEAMVPLKKLEFAKVQKPRQNSTAALCIVQFYYKLHMKSVKDLS